MSDKPVRVRFAPSPTGSIHIGSVRTALFNWLFARHHGGSFILRIEDTDQKRFVEGSTELILNGLRWLGMDWDEGPEAGGEYGPYFQSERLEIYRQWAEWLVDNDKAYRAYETPEELDAMREAAQKNGQRFGGYNRQHRYLSEDERQKLHDERDGMHVIRFKMPIDGSTRVHDIIRGDIVFDNKELNDLVLLKADGFPTYHLANVVDDHLMQISHIMRGEEWIPTAPIHWQLYNAFGWEMPAIAHLPVILNPNGKGKMSKRIKMEDADGKVVPVILQDYIDGGYLPEALMNFLTNVGWAYGDDREIFTVPEAIERFDLNRVNPAGSAFPAHKLDWINGVYIREMDVKELAQRIKPHIEQAGFSVNEEKLQGITPHIQERMKTLKEAAEWTAFIFTEDFQPAPAEEHIPKKLDAAQTRDLLQAVHDTLAELDDFDHPTIEATLRELAEAKDVKAGQLFNPVRVSTSAQSVAPPLFQSIEVLGKETTLERLKLSLDILDKHLAKASS